MEFIQKTDAELENEINILLQTEIYPTYDRFNETRNLGSIAFLDDKLHRLKYLIEQLDQSNSKLANFYKERSKMLLTKDELLDNYLMVQR